MTSIPIKHRKWLCDAGNSVRLAASRVLRDAGDRDGASRLLDALADPDASTDDDPWWRYDDTHVPTAQDLLAGLPHLLDRP